MKRLLLSILVALVFLLHVGTISVDAAEEGYTDSKARNSVSHEDNEHTSEDSKLSDNIIQGIKDIFKTDGQGLVDDVKGMLEDFRFFSVTTNLLLSDDVLGAEETGSIIQKVYDLVYPTAFLLMCVIWLFSVAKSCVSTDLWNKESFIKPLMRLVWSVAVMTVSMPLLEIIFTVFHRLAWETAITTGIKVLGSGMFLEDIIDDLPGCVDSTPLFGRINTLKNVFVLASNHAPSLVMNVFFGLILYVIISMRYIKLATLQCISPFFFACAGSEKADRYLHSFLKEYIILAAQIFIAIIMYSFLTVINDTMVSGSMLSGAVHRAVAIFVYLAGMICVCGSAKFLRNLFN